MRQAFQTFLPGQTAEGLAVPHAHPDKAGSEGIRIARLGEDVNITAVTRLLHHAYAALANMGLNYTATTQSDRVTLERAATGECWVAFAGEVLVGTILFRPAEKTSGSPWLDRSDAASFGQFGVLPEWQGRGIGSQLITHAEQRAAQTGAGEIALDTAESAVHLLALYQSKGFRPVDHVRWPNANYRSVVMSKPTTDAAR